MKHLKRYNESFNQSDYYNEISQPEIDKLPTLLSIEEIRELKDKIKDLIGSDYKDLGTKFTYYHTHLQNLQEKRESFIILYEEKTIRHQADYRCPERGRWRQIRSSIRSYEGNHSNASSKKKLFLK